MSNSKHRLTNSSDLRRQAEEKAGDKALASSEVLAAQSPEERDEILHELRVHQIELELQNEELRRIQAELEASQERLNDLYDFAPVGYLTESETGMVVEANLTAASLLGVTRGSLLKRPLNRFILPEDQDIYRRHRQRLLETEGPEICELRMLRPDNPPFWARMEALAAHDQEGATMYRVILSDITASWLAETERQKLKERLAHIQRMESMERLAAGVANDFNNMLGIILGNAEMALEQADPDQPFFANLQEIGKAVDRSAHLTWQLLSFARMQTVATHGLDLNETVEGMLTMLRRLVGTDIDLVWKPEAGLWPVTMDSSQIEQILVNLCVNSRDAIIGKGHITVEVKNTPWKADDNVNQAGFPPGEYVAIIVGDDGSGIVGEVVDRLFEPFFTTKKVGQSTGLGLAIVYGIVKQNNGFITVRSEPALGTVFKIYLPRHGTAVEQPDRVERENPAGGPHAVIDASGPPVQARRRREKKEVTF